MKPPVLPTLTKIRTSLYDTCELYPGEAGFRSRLCSTGFDPARLDREWRQFSVVEGKDESLISQVIGVGPQLSHPRIFRCEQVALAFQPLVRGGLDARTARADVHAIRGALSFEVRLGIGTVANGPGTLLPLRCDFTVEPHIFFGTRLRLHHEPELHYAWRLVTHLHGELGMETI